MNKAFLAGAALQAAVLLAPPSRGPLGGPLALSSGDGPGPGPDPLVVCEIEKGPPPYQAGRRAAREEKSPVYR